MVESLRPATDPERDVFDLHGLLPPQVGSLDEQIERRLEALRVALRIHNTMSLGYVRSSLSSQFLSPGMTAWKTEQGVDFNSLLDVLPMLLLQSVVQVLRERGRRRAACGRFWIQNKGGILKKIDLTTPYQFLTCR